MKNKKARLRSQADRLWFEAVIKEHNCICEVCLEKGHQAHHFVPKGMSNALRYDLKNGVCLCQGCHFSHHHKGDPSIHLAIMEKRGKKWWGYLKKKRSEVVKPTVKWYNDNIKWLEKLL